MPEITIQPYTGGGNFFDQFDSTGPAPAAPAQSPFAGAISKVESGGNYRAIGPDTGGGNRALGKYQVMASNVGPWSQEVLGRQVTPQEFLATPELQDQIFNAKFGGYVDKYGPEGAARAWFAGEGGMNKPDRRDVLGTSVSDYSRKFMNAMGPGTAQAAPQQPQQAQGTRNFFDQFDGADQPQPTNQQAPQPSQQQAPQAPQSNIGRGESFASGAAQGVSLNFYDELRGLMEAGGLDPKDPASLSALLKGAYQYWSGDQQAEQTYNTTSERERAAAKAAAEANPGSSLVGNLAGAVALPIGAIGQAATLPGRMAVGAGTGAALGAGYGAGEGVGATDRASRALTGGAIGGVIGGAAPAVIEGVTRGVKSVAAPIANTVRGMRNPEREASRRVVSALQRDARNGSAGLTPNEMFAARSSGVPVANMDMGGEMTRALGRSAANTSPDARAVLNKVIDDRFVTQSGRAADEISALVNTPAKAGMTREALEQAAQKSRAPFYRIAYRDGANGVWDAELQQMSQAPVMQKAIKEATASVQNKVASGRAMNPVSKNGTPTLEFWDQVKRNLDSAFNVARRAGDKETAADIQSIKTALVQKLDDAVPSYAVARGVAAELFKANDALDAGEKFVSSTLKNAEVSKALGKMTPEERTLFAEGFASKLVEKINESGDRRNVINSIMKSPAARERTTLALGSNAVQRLDAFTARESIMDRWRGAIQGNSTTARQLVEAGLAGGAYGAYTGNWDMSTVLTGAIVFGARRGQMKIDERVAKRVGEMLASNDPMVLQKGLKIVAGNATISKALRATEEYLTTAAAQQSPKTGIIPAIQLPAMGRADSENDQPAVPRPPGQ